MNFVSQHWRLTLLLIAVALASFTQLPAQQISGPNTVDLDQLEQSRDAGLLTDWHLAGPFGKHGAADFIRAWPPERGVRSNHHGAHQTDLVFAAGLFMLPSSLPGTGVYYATSRTYIRSDADWNLWMESPGAIELFVDGNLVMSRGDRTVSQERTVHQAVRLTRGDHQLMVKFMASASPFRVAIMPPSGGQRRPKIHDFSGSPESQYVPAALRRESLRRAPSVRQ